MAQCEKCGVNGHDMRSMLVDKETKIFIGPCCIKANPNDMFNQDVQYGVEFSSHMGLRAYATYGGFSIEFKKTKEDIQKWFEKPQTEEPIRPPDETTSETAQEMVN